MAKSLFNNYLSSLSVDHNQPEGAVRFEPIDNNDLFDDAHEDVSEVKPKNNTLPPKSSPKNESGTQKTEYQKAIITKNMIITGSVEVVTDMDIHGTVHGSVTSQGNLLVTGLVEGDIVTKGVTIVTPKLQANVSASDFIDVHENCEIIGNLSANNISINGSIKGDINALGHIILKENAVVAGDLQTGSLEIKKGAVINGKIAFLPAN